MVSHIFSLLTAESFPEWTTPTQWKIVNESDHWDHWVSDPSVDHMAHMLTHSQTWLNLDTFDPTTSELLSQILYFSCQQRTYFKLHEVVYLSKFVQFYVGGWQSPRLLKTVKSCNSHVWLWNPNRPPVQMNSSFLLHIPMLGEVPVDGGIAQNYASCCNPLTTMMYPMAIYSWFTKNCDFPYIVTVC